MLNTDTISSAINVNHDTSSLSINAKPMGLISYQCLYGHKHIIDQRQTNWRDQLSMSFHGHKHVIDQCQTNGHNFFRTRPQLLSRSNQSGVSKSMNLRFMCYKLKLIDVITNSTSSSMSHD